MKNLHDRIAEDVARWRAEGYPCSRYPIIKHLLAYQWDEREETTRYLRAAQMQALETYWFLRLEKETPRFMALYKSYYEGEDLLKVLGVPYHSSIISYTSAVKYIEDCAEKKEKEIPLSETFRESYHLQYPSYIFALTMGAGKTVLIGAIIATEFSMSLEYPDGNFMKNALVFAPGTTIIESLRELSDIPYESILPEDNYKKFNANLKIRYTSVKNKKINTLGNSRYNLVVSNTERIILRQRSALPLQERGKLEENHRFHDLAQLPNLGIFSDEAHHTYGNKSETDLKRVRQTINRLHELRKLVCVVNTTGTPYYKKQFLKDVVIWYGIEEGIKQKVLKSLYDGIKSYSIEKENYSHVAQRIVKDFFATYSKVALPEGQKAKIAFYFNRQEDLDGVKGAIEKALVDVGVPPNCLLANTQKSSPKEVDEFNRLNSPLSNKRVILLVGKGREGWNCPSLFACALITKQTSSHNHVLQSSTRCLRRVVGNDLPARIYLDSGNKNVLSQQLAENFGEHFSLSALGAIEPEQQEVTVEILKTSTPRLVVDSHIDVWQREEGAGKALRLRPPDLEAILPHIKESIMDVQWKDEFMVLVEKRMRRLPIEEVVSLERAAVEIALPLHFDVLEVLRALKGIYGTAPIAKHHIPELRRQAEESLGAWQHRQEVVRRVMALIHTKDEQGEPLFREREGGGLFHVLRFAKTRFEHMIREGLLVSHEEAQSGGHPLQLAKDEKQLSFHYSPYDLANKSERETFGEILQYLNIKRHEVEGFYYTGSLTDPRKTDMWFEYKGADNRFHRYFPDFVLVKKSGEWLIVEVKGERDREHPDTERKAKAVERIVALQPEKIQYHSVFLPSESFEDIKGWIDKGGPS